MSRYVNRNLPTVSQEFTVIELAVGLGVGVAVYKAIKKLASEKKAEANKAKTKTSKMTETSADKLARVVSKLEKSVFIKGRVEAVSSYLGDPKGDDAKEIVSHLKTITKALRSVIGKVETDFEKINKLGERYNSDGIDELDFEEQNDDAIAKMCANVLSTLGDSFEANGFKLTKSGNGFNSEYRTLSKNKESIRSPNPTQLHELLVTAGHLLELQSRFSKLTFLEYSQSSMDWTYEIVDMLKDTLDALLNYLDDAIEKIN